MTYVIDTETTGFDNEIDEILQLSIIDADENVVFDGFFKPIHNKRWDEAMAVNQITPEMVENAPAIADRIAQLNEIFAKAEKIIGYNTGFDLGFIKAAGISIPDNAEIVDVMPAFAEIYGEWNDYHGSYRWQSLSTASRYYKYDWDSHKGQAHNSLSDCYATLYVYSKMEEHKKAIDDDPSIKVKYEVVSPGVWYEDSTGAEIKELPYEYIPEQPNNLSWAEKVKWKAENTLVLTDKQRQYMIDNAESIGNSLKSAYAILDDKVIEDYSPIITDEGRKK